MKQPINLYEWSKSALVSELSAASIHTFSNGTEWECWAEPNCLSCRWWDQDEAGKDCALEGAALLGWVTPELAARFGWIQTETKYGPKSGWTPPEECPYFFARRDDGDYSDDPTPTCPSTLSLFADQRTTHNIASPLSAPSKRANPTPARGAA